MSNSLVERQIESYLQSLIGDGAKRIVRGVSNMAAKQGGESTLENYQLLGKRALIVLGVAIVAVQVTTSAVGLVVSRKSEEKRMEQVARRVFEEERQKEETES